MDILSYRDSRIHRLESRAKLITTMCFIVTVVSFGKYEIAMLVPFFLYPVYLVTAGELPVSWLLKKIAYVSPFALLIAAFNPLLDREVMLRLGGAGIPGGWISFASIMLRFILTVGAALAMIAVTGFQSVCLALNRLGMPRMFTIQLLFLYRYLFVLAEEASRMSLARALRSYDGRAGGVRTYAAVVGNLLLRTINRAQRIYVAMSCRGFDGHIHVMRRERFGMRELFFIIFWCGLFIVFRFVNIPRAIGALVTGGLL
jgi:cobalt/nickel transport system permease protein